MTKALDAEYVSALISAFNTALRSTPQDMDLTERARLALSLLPDPVVREIGDAADVLVSLARERTGEPRREATTPFYQGKASLITPSGYEQPVNVMLRVSQFIAPDTDPTDGTLISEGVKEWDGTLSATEPLTPLSYAGPLTLRLPDGREGTVRITSSIYGDGAAAADLQGDGPPPSLRPNE